MDYIYCASQSFRNIELQNTGVSHYLLSKTSYLRGLQCSKSLFLYRHYPQLRDPVSPARQAVFNRGHDVGRLAHELFPGGIDVSRGIGPKSEQIVQKTAELIAKGAEILYEAAFVFNDILIIADILVKEKEGWHLYEVKSSLRISRTYLNDAALQYYVIKGAGLAVKNVSLIHVNPDYIRGKQFELHEYFRIVPVDNDIRYQQKTIANRIAALKNVLNSSQIPEVAIGSQCFSPYECDFMGQCWKQVNDDSVFRLTGISRQVQEEYFRNGVRNIADVPESAELPRITRLQVKASHTGLPVIDKEKIKTFFKPYLGAVMFLDIENVQHAVPRYEGTRPFMALPFAYSIHINDGKGNSENRTFIAQPGEDPRIEFLKSFLNDTAGEVPIFSYDITAERQAINHLIRFFPEYETELKQRNDRLVDLMKPFAQGWYHHPQMKGSISLKNVLPALVPELSHADLRVQNGSHAMSVFEKMCDSTDLFEQAELRDALEEYCKMDTLGMVEIYRKLTVI
ncbi:MAG: hypothetical protein Fur0041_10760 [Bacteroidia bacterium]